VQTQLLFIKYNQLVPLLKTKKPIHTYSQPKKTLAHTSPALVFTHYTLLFTAVAVQLV